MSADSSDEGPTSYALLYEGLRRRSDEERRRLARALHDSASQTLAAACMSLSMCDREAQALSPEARQALTRAFDLVSAAGEELRALSHDLHPPLLAEVGLPPALRWLGRKLGDGRMRVDVPADLPRVAAATELAAYRLIEEAVTGFFAHDAYIAGHVGAADGAGLVIRLAGRGRQDGMALARMALRQRARGAGGTLQVRRAVDGLVVDARFPG